MRVLYQLNDTHLYKDFATWNEFGDFFSDIINNEVVYHWDGDMSCLIGRLQDHNLNEELFTVSYNKQELILNNELIYKDPRAYYQIKSITDCFYNHSVIFFDLIDQSTVSTQSKPKTN